MTILIATIAEVVYVFALAVVLLLGFISVRIFTHE